MDDQRFVIRSQVIGADDPQLQEVLAQIYDTPERPRCLCVPDGVGMYVTRHRRFVIKRMPDSGSAHHPGCPSCKPEARQSGLGELMGDAVLESAPGQIELRVDFPWTRMTGCSVRYGEPHEVAEIGVPRRQMTLRALMHFLFERAGFNRWSPAMAGKRNQGVLCKYLLEAAEEIMVKGVPLVQRLYVPEPFSESAKTEVARRRREKLAVLVPDGATGQQPMESPEEAAERQEIQASRRAIALQRDQQAKRYRASLDRLQTTLAALPAPYDEQRLSDTRAKMEQSAQLVATAEKAYLVAVQDAEALGALERQVLTLSARQAQVAHRIAHIEIELGNWNLFAKCMSNDGLIALAIDDAGPALSGLANDLLLACYGPRFTVSILTLVETAKGEQKEGFDILVHDSESNESKSIGLMSGGERTWIESCLTRAIALYLAQHAGRRYQTLFSDEADGALDPERKRMFMAMKREVLRLGGYEREFFISQTPHLTAMADRVINLDALQAGIGSDAGRPLEAIPT